MLIREAWKAARNRWLGTHDQMSAHFLQIDQQGPGGEGLSFTFSNPGKVKGLVLRYAPQCPQQHFHKHMKCHASILYTNPKNYRFTPQSNFEQQENTFPLQFPSLFGSPSHSLPQSLWTQALIPALAFRKLIKAKYFTSGALVPLLALQKLCAEAQQCSSSTACKSHAGKSPSPVLPL